MEKIELFKLLLKKEYFKEYEGVLDEAIFPELLQDLYESLVLAQSKTNYDITCKDIWYTHCEMYPALTESKKNVIKELLAKVNDSEDLTPEIATSAIESALKEQKATRIANAALDIAHGRAEDFDEIQRILDKEEYTHDIELVSTDVEELIDDLSATYKWRFSLPELNERVGPIGPEVFTVLAGPVNSGKSLMGISFVFSPGGFADQGAKCLYIGNEESLKRTMVRGICCYTGMNRDEIAHEPEKAQEKFNEIRENIYVIDDVTMTFPQLVKTVEKMQPDIVVVDMLDKVSISGTFQRDDERLGKIYEQARELAKVNQCAVFGLSQTNAETFGKLTIEQHQMTGSRVHKAANADLVLTLGSHGVDADVDNNLRRIFVAKSKLKGNGARIECKIDPELSRLLP